MVRANALYLQALLALVVVTMASPGLVGLDESDPSVVLLDTDVVDLGAAGEEPAADPAKEGKPGDSEQIKAILIEAIHEAKLPLSGAELKQFIEVEAPLATAAIQKTEKVPGFWNKVIAEVEAKMKAQENPEKVVPPTKADDPTRAYHKILTKLTTKMGWHKTLPEADLAKFLVSSASKLATTESSSGGASSFVTDEIARLKKRAEKLAGAAKQQEAILQEAQQNEGGERKSKDELASAGRRKEAATKVAAEEELATIKAKNKAKEASKQYDAQWLKLKETTAEERKVDAEKTACVVRLTKAEKALRKTRLASQEATNAVQVLAQELETARQGKKAEAVGLLEKSSRAAGLANTGKLKELEDVKRVTATIKAECEAISVRAADMKGRVKKMKVDTQRDEDKKKMLQRQVKTKAKEAAAGKETAEAINKGFEKEATKATSMETVINIVSATHYCGMKKDPQTKEWKPTENGYRGSADEAGNQSDEAKKVCNGKEYCTIKIPQATGGCPSPGYIARFKCGDADVVSQKSSLIELNESDGSDEESAKEAESLKGLESELKATPKAESNADKLLSKLESIETKADKKEDILEAVAKSSKDTALSVACPKPTMSADMKASLDKESKASEALEKDEVIATKAAEKVVEKIEESVVEKKDELQAAKNVLAKAEEAKVKAEDAAVNAKDEVKELEATVEDGGPSKPMSAEQTNETAKDKAALEKAAKVASDLEQAAKTKKAAAEAAERAEKKAAEKEQEAEQVTGQVKNAPSPAVKTAKKLVDIAKSNVVAANEALETLKKQVKNTKDPTVVLALVTKINAAVAAVKRAEAAEKSAETGDKSAVEAEKEATVEAEKEAVDKAKETESDAQLQVAVLEAKAAVGGSRLAKSEASIQIQTEKAKIAKAKKVIDSENALKREIEIESQEQAAAKAQKAVETATRELQTKEDELRKLKARIAIAKSSEQVVDLTDKLTKIVTEVKESKEALVKAQKIASAKLTPGSDTLKAVAAAQADCDHIGMKIAGLKSKISTTKHPESVKAFTKELIAAEADEKKAFKKLAAAKTAQVEDEKRVKSSSAESVQKEPAAVSNDPEVRKAREATNTAKIKQAAAAEEAAEDLKRKLAETKLRQDAKVKADKAAANKAEDKAEKASQQTLDLEEQIKKQAQDAADLRLIKKNILDGRDPLAGAVTPQEAALKALGKEPPRSVEDVTRAIKILKSATPGSATCGKGMKCCISSFGDSRCKVQMQSSCIVSNSAELQPWSTLLIAPLEAGQADAVSFETRWVKDPSIGIDNKGSILRLRVCGKFSKDKTGCFPKEGAGLKFEDFFNSPLGSCTMAKDLFTVSQGPLKAQLVKHLTTVASQNSPSSKADAATQAADKEADEKHRQERNVQGAFTPASAPNPALKELVSELLQLEDGEALSAKPLMEMTGSFSFVKKPSK